VVGGIFDASVSLVAGVDGAASFAAAGVGSFGLAAAGAEAGGVEVAGVAVDADAGGGGETGSCVAMAGVAFGASACAVDWLSGGDPRLPDHTR
jgi:hypothetical protein